MLNIRVRGSAVHVYMLLDQFNNCDILPKVKIKVKLLGF